MRSYERSLLLVLIPLSTVSAKEKSLLITVENPGDFERKSETVSLSLKELHFGAVDMNHIVVTDAQKKTDLLCQTTESELLFQSGFHPHEKKEFIVRLSDHAAAGAEPLVDGRFVPPREDYAWENDRIAFRMYGPALAKEVNNGVDVWTKRVRYLIVAKWYKASEGGPDAYHEDHGEGADFFTVGRSLGAGGCGIWYEGKVRQPGVFSSYKTLCIGPIRTAFELTYRNWNLGNARCTQHVRISLDAGQNLNTIRISFDSLDMKDLQLACGLVKRKGTTVHTSETNRWMSLWGLTTEDTVNGSLGTGIVMPRSTTIRFTEDNDQYLVVVNADAHVTFTYYAGAGWTRSGDFSSADDWNSYLDSFSRRIQTPLKILITPEK